MRACSSTPMLRAVSMSPDSGRGEVTTGTGARSEDSGLCALIGMALGAGFVVASNHSTYIDPAWLSVPIRSQLRYMAWNKAMEWPLVDPFIRHLGAFPVKHRTHITKSAVAEALSSLKDGAALIVFPEDDRKFDDGRLLEFKSGAVHIATHAGVPFTPVSIREANRVWPRGQRYPSLFRRIDVIFHPPITVPPKPEGVELRDHLERTNEQLASIIRSGL